MPIEFYQGRPLEPEELESIRQQIEQFDTLKRSTRKCAESPPSLLAIAACGGLRSAPNCRTRRALLHLSYSCASPHGLAMLVTQDPQRKSSPTWEGGNRAALPSVGDEARRQAAATRPVGAVSRRSRKRTRPWSIRASGTEKVGTMTSG